MLAVYLVTLVGSLLLRKVDSKRLAYLLEILIRLFDVTLDANIGRVKAVDCADELCGSHEVAPFHDANVPSWLDGQFLGHAARISALYLTGGESMKPS